MKVEGRATASLAFVAFRACALYLSWSVVLRIADLQRREPLRLR